MGALLVFLPLLPGLQIVPLFGLRAGVFSGHRVGIEIAWGKGLIYLPVLSTGEGVRGLATLCTEDNP